MVELTRWQEWTTRRGFLRDRYWRWYMRRLDRWAKRHNVPSAPPLEELLDEETLRRLGIEGSDG